MFEGGGSDLSANFRRRSVTGCLERICNAKITPSIHTSSISSCRRGHHGKQRINPHRAQSVDRHQFGGLSGDLNACEYKSHDMAAIVKDAGYLKSILLTKEAASPTGEPVQGRHAEDSDTRTREFHWQRAAHQEPRLAARRSQRLRVTCKERATTASCRS